MRPSLPLLAAAFAGLLVACDDGAQVVAKPAFLAADRDFVDFGLIAVGDSDERVVFLFNRGDLPLVLQEPTGDLYGGTFTLLLGDDQIAPGESTKLHVVFAPRSAIAFNTEIVVPNGSNNEPEFKIRLKGTGKQTDPCQDKVCNSPPPRFCANSGTSRQFNPVGRCEAGNCVYDPIDETCGEFGCDSSKGQCAGDPCIGVACQQPPNACFLQQGLCQRGACIYTSNDNGVCTDNDPCTINDTCGQGNCHGTRLDCTGQPTQPPVCLSATKLRKYSRTGACNGGVCVETAIEVDCQFGCETVGFQGQCKGDPCAVPFDDGNPCTEEYCDNAGWHSRPTGPTACNTGSEECPRGTCNAGVCLTNAGASCSTEVDVDLCHEQRVPGTCTGDGRCLPNATPNADCMRYCSPENVACLQCTIGGVFPIRLCF